MNMKPRRRRLNIGASDGRGSERPKPAPATIDAVRSEADDVRMSVHESSHAVVGRGLTGEAIGGVTIIAGPNFGGLCWGPNYVRRAKYGEGEVPELCSQIAPLMPGPGEPRAQVADIFLHCFNRITEIVAGTEGERMLLDGEPWFAVDDERQAIALALLVTSSPASAAAFIAACRAEAIALLTASAHIVRALADELRVARTMNGAEVDVCIEQAVAAKELADEKERQRQWRAIEANAARLAINQTGMRRGASRSERVDEAVAVVRAGANVRQACKIVGLSRGERDVARRCDQRGVPRKRSPALPVWHTTEPFPGHVPQRK